MSDWQKELTERAPDSYVADRVYAALSRLLINDAHLLEIDANERSISHHLALYLQEELPEWDVDCEYNRDGHDPKRLQLKPERIQSNDTRGRTVYPDIIVHKRGKVGKTGRPENLLAIEIKKSNGGSARKDIRKLRALRTQLGYQYALFLQFDTGTSTSGVAKTRWIKDSLSSSNVATEMRSL